MGQMLGADPDGLRTLAAHFGNFEQMLNTNRTALNVLVHVAPWQGENADRFRHDWNAKYMGILGSVASALGTAKLQLEANAKQQEWASSADPQGGMPGMPTGAARGAASVGSDIKHGLSSLMHDQLSALKQGVNEGLKQFDEVKHTAAHDLHWLANSPGFKDVVTWSGYAGTVLSFATPFLAPIPVVGEIALGVNAVHFAGEALEMAEGTNKNVDVKTLALDGAGVVFGATDVAGLTALTGDAAKAAPEGLTFGTDVSKIAKVEAGQFNAIRDAAVAAGVNRNVATALQVGKAVSGGAETLDAGHQALEDARAGEGLRSTGQTVVAGVDLTDSAGITTDVVANLVKGLRS